MRRTGPMWPRDNVVLFFISWSFRKFVYFKERTTENNI